MTSHTFLFADLCGFTDYTRRHGDEFAARLAVRFHDRAGELAAEEGCELVKSIGDAVMIAVTVWYFGWAKNTFKGPIKTVDEGLDPDFAHVTSSP